MWNGWPAGSCARDQHQAEHADREDHDQDDQRRPHPAHDHEDRRRRLISGAQPGPPADPRRVAPSLVVAEQLLPEDQQRRCSRPRSPRHRRWNETVSTTSSTTETRLASSAPPDSDTTLAIACAVTPSAETCAA